MKSVETHPTPQRVVDAIHVVASWVREINAAEAVIAPTGGAAFHAVRQADELLAGWEAAEQASSNARTILARILAEPYGCPMCDSGMLRKGAPEHWPECGYGQARALLEE